MREKFVMSGMTDVMFHDHPCGDWTQDEMGYRVGKFFIDQSKNIGNSTVEAGSATLSMNQILEMRKSIGSMKKLYLRLEMEKTKKKLKRQSI